MSPRIVNYVLLVFLGLLTGVVWGQGQEVCEKYAFEESSLAGWEGGAEIASIVSESPFAGTSCLQLNPDNKTGGQIYRQIVLPAVKEPKARLLRIALNLKTLNLQKGEVTIRLLKVFDKGRSPEWFDHKGPEFAVLPVSPQWTKVVLEGRIGPEVKGLTFYISIQNGSGRGRVWLDDVSFELLDRGLLLQTGKLGNIVAADRAEVDVVISSPENLKTGIILLVDEEKRNIGQIALKPGKKQVKIELPSRGYYEINAHAEYIDGVQCQTSMSAAVVGPLIPDEMRMNSPFGLVGEGEPFILAGARWDRPNIDLRTERFQKAAQAGFPNETSLIKKTIEPPKCTSIYFFGAPNWLQDRGGKSLSENPLDMYPMKDWGQFRRLVQYAIRTNPYPIEYVEVANEPECVWKGPWTGLVRYYKEMSRAVKSVNPAIKVLGPSLCAIKINELQTLHQMGFFDCIDGVSIHPYVRSTAPEGEFIDLVRSLKRYLVSIGKKGFPIVFTEYGWPIPPGDWQKPVDPLTQARYVSRSLTLLTAEQIDVIQYFNLNWFDPNASAATYSLLNGDWTPRPSYAAYSVAVRALTGVKGPGKILPLTPTSYLALFKKGSGTLAAVWDVKGTAQFVIPEPWTCVYGMMGRSVLPTGDRRITIGPSPVFIELPNDSFFDVKERKLGSVIQGGAISLPFSLVHVPEPLTFKVGKLQVPSNTPAGPYRLINKTAEGYETFGFDVIVPVEVVAAGMVWPKNEPYPKLKVEVKSTVGSPLVCHMQVPGILEKRVTVQPKYTGSVYLPLTGYKLGKRYIGRVILEDKTLQILAEREVDFTLIVCTQMKENIDWARVPIMDISNWSSRSENGQSAKDDGSVRFQIGSSMDRLYLRIFVRDDEHQQDQLPSEMWREDSLQIGFDMDTDKPWVANQGGFNGHFNVFEYGIGDWRNGPMNWRWISYNNSLPIDRDEKNISAHISRHDKITEYQVAFPWKVLGLDARPSFGSTCGFSLTVNDADVGHERHTISLFGGIVDKKDPVEYGKIWFR